MAYNYPPGTGQGYPPQQGGYPPQQGYPPAGGYPPAPCAGGYPPAPGAGGYPPAPGGGGYPPAPGGGGYPPAPGGGYPSAPGGYPQAPGGGYGVPQAGGIGFEGLSSQPGGPPPQQPPAQSYGAPTPQYGYGATTPVAGGYPAQQPYAGAPPQQGYSAPGQPYQQQTATHAQPAYGAPAPAAHGQGAGQLVKGMAGMKIATHGTLRPYSGFNAETDAQVLRKAMKGLGTDEKAIIGVIGARSSDQRQKIKTTYKQAYGRDLIKDLKSELSGNFEDLAVALFMKPREYDAYCLHDAMVGAGTTESTLIEILVSRTNEEIKEINEIYKKFYGKNLEKELMSETSGHFRKLLVSLNNASRDTSTQVNTTKANEDAQRLYSAGEKKWGTDEATFNMVMASRSFPQLRATFEAYHRIANRDIIRSIKGEFSGDIEDGLVSLVEVVQNAPGYFARRLYQSMKGAGTCDKDLIRAVVTRCEVDMVEVKQQFKAMFKKDLPGYIKDDTSGDYRRLLLALVGN